MEIKKRERKSPKRIVFNVSEQDHQVIKEHAARARIPMQMWIMNALAKSIREESIN